ncbi:MAG: hypothetical protein DRP60_13220 [Spirochaetes bacterium]|nr:MAG: hypothetical protein DRP60_13220 [Spirochaetota bacterium]
MADFERIRKECYWDLNVSEDDIRMILNGSDQKHKTSLLNKILENSTKLLLDLQLFPELQLKIMLENFTVPQFKHEYLYRRKNIAEAFFFDKNLEIDELKWQA